MIIEYWLIIDDTSMLVSNGEINFEKIIVLLSRQYF